MDNLGALIRKQRKHNGVTLKQLAEKTKLSISFLSEIERGVAKPSMDSLRKIAQSLSISLLSFTDSQDSQVTNPMRLANMPNEVIRSKYINTAKVVRAGQRKKLGYPDRPGYYELLTPDFNRELEVLYVKLDPGFETGPEPIIDPPGEKFILVMKGHYQITISGEIHILNAGDSISYPADAPVFFKCLSDYPTELILVLTPPGF
ncbi:MAG: MerR family transcriptional regulator [Anaerospora sp.]|jgi:transcriptional regulator with XRE-family HTH domain|nr:MerR family transcriptional regulator [Anaerospora sp.]